MSTPATVPTPQDLAARLDRLGRPDGSWTGENLEDLQSLTEYLADRGITLEDLAKGWVRTDEPAPSPTPSTGERHRSWSEQETRELLDRAEAALGDAEDAAVAGERWVVAGRRVEAAVLVAMAGVRTVGQLASAGHRCASALHDVAAAVRPRGAR